MEISEGLKWIVGTVVTLATMLIGGLGLGRLFEMAKKRRYDREDKNSENTQANETRKIDFDQFAFQTFYNEFSELKKEVKEISKELNSQMQANARLETENKHLKETNERQEKEMILMRDRLETEKLASCEREAILNQQVTNLTNIVVQLRNELEQLKTLGIV